MPKIDLFFKVFFTGLLAALGFGVVVDIVCSIISPAYYSPTGYDYLSFMTHSISKFWWIGVLVGYTFGLAAMMADVDSQRLRLIYKSMGVVFLAIALLYCFSTPSSESEWLKLSYGSFGYKVVTPEIRLVDGIQVFIQDNAKIGILAGVAHYIVFMIKQDSQKRYNIKLLQK